MQKGSKYRFLSFFFQCFKFLFPVWRIGVNLILFFQWSKVFFSSVYPSTAVFVSPIWCRLYGHQNRPFHHLAAVAAVAVIFPWLRLWWSPEVTSGDPLDPDIQMNNGHLDGGLWLMWSEVNPIMSPAGWKVSRGESVCWNVFLGVLHIKLTYTLGVYPSNVPWRLETFMKSWVNSSPQFFRLKNFGISPGFWGLRGAIAFKWVIFHCQVWLLEGIMHDQGSLKDTM